MDVTGKVLEWWKVFLDQMLLGWNDRVRVTYAVTPPKRVYPDGTHRQLLRLMMLTIAGKSALLVALWEFSYEYTLELAHRMHKKCHKLLSFLRSELTQVRVCLFVLFFHPLGCVLRICKECEIPRARVRKATRGITGHEWFKEAEIVGSVDGYQHKNIHRCWYLVFLYQR